MFALPIAARFSKAEDSETIFEKIKDIIYNRSSVVFVLNLKELPIAETNKPLRMIMYIRWEYASITSMF
jgi:hypothetical protein